MLPVIAAMAAMQVVNGMHQAQMVRMQADTQNQINEMNAKWAEVDAWKTKQKGDEEVARYDTEIDQTVGDQRVAYAEQDVDVNYGTAAAVQAETKLTGFLNKIEMRNQATAAAMGIQRQARNALIQGGMQATQANATANAAQTTGALNAATPVTGYYARK